MKKFNIAAFISSLTLLTSTGYVQATTASADFTVQATVAASCKIEVVSNIDFGNYVPDQDKYGQGTLRVTCIKGDAPTVSLLGGGATVGDRNLNNGTENIAYSLYQPTDGTTACVESSLSKLWGIGDQKLTLAEFNGYVGRDYSVCGKIAAGQNTLSKGTYTGTVTAEVSY